MWRVIVIALLFAGVVRGQPNAFEFDGSTGFLDMADGDQFNFSDGDFALSAWVKPDSTAGVQAIISKWLSGQRQFHLGINDLGAGNVWFG